MNALDLLKNQHRVVGEMLGRLEQAQVPERRWLLETLGEMLAIHAGLEQELLYPMLLVLDEQRGEELVTEGFEAHRAVDRMIADLAEREDDRKQRDRLSLLRTTIVEHMLEEEEDMFQVVAALGDDELDELGEEMARRQEEIRRTRAA